MTLKDCTDAVALFQKTYGLPHRHVPTTQVDPSETELRHRLMAEENDEYLAAAQAGDMVEVADALGDMLYILCGTMVTHGMQDVMAEAVFDHGPDGEVRSYKLDCVSGCTTVSGFTAG